MTEQAAYLNPTDETFDFEFCKEFSYLFTDCLGKENCYNPLVAYHGRRVFLAYCADQLNKNRPISIGILTYDGLKKQNLPPLKWSDSNPEDRFRFEPSLAAELNSAWYGFLRSLREAFQDKDFCKAVQILNNVYYSFSEVGFSLQDFIKLGGILFGCKWLMRVPDAKASAGYSDALYPSSIMQPDEIPVGWMVFAGDAGQFRTCLTDCYKALGKPNTEEFGFGDFKGACEALTKGNMSPSLFNLLITGVQDVGRLFEKSDDVFLRAAHRRVPNRLILGVPHVEVVVMATHAHVILGAGLLIEAHEVIGIEFVGLP